jgi:hypothetical protein
MKKSEIQIKYILPSQEQRELIWHNFYNSANNTGIQEAYTYVNHRHS